MSREGFGKKQREKAKQERAQAKRDRRANRAQTEDADEAARPPEAAVLIALEALHRQFDADEIDFEEYEQRKHDLTSQLDV